MAESLLSDQAFFASGDQRGASEVSLYNLKTARDRGSQWGGGFYGYRLKFLLFYGYRLIFFSYG